MSDPAQAIRIKRWFKRGVIALFILYLVAIEWFPLPDAGDRIDRLPVTAFGITSKEIPFTDAEVAALGAACASRREYLSGGQRVMVTLLDGNQNRHAVHDPLYCVHGSGWKVTRTETFKIPGGSAKRLFVEKNGLRSEILYWFSTPRQKHASLVRYRLHTVLRKLTFGASGVEPVLILLQPATDPSLDWLAFMTDFVYLSDL